MAFGVLPELNHLPPPYKFLAFGPASWWTLRAATLAATVKRYRTGSFHQRQAYTSAVALDEKGQYFGSLNDIVQEHAQARMNFPLHRRLNSQGRIFTSTTSHLGDTAGLLAFLGTVFDSQLNATAGDLSVGFSILRWRRAR
ncbi:hypothetical protein D9611_009008 [Ephemerocybe angulata]|uniref:Uncharacterized protein n=1 Tax=Ephemerocybe angulata TaxID=980116 RepID=A0A8H5BYM9_9AGAR|nr:hypothetical protein D9611_009008 [Tulosesus angulatus]